LATYLAFFSVTYLATSLKLAKFSVTERTAALNFKVTTFFEVGTGIWGPAYYTFFSFFITSLQILIAKEA